MTLRVVIDKKIGWLLFPALLLPPAACGIYPALPVRNTVIILPQIISTELFCHIDSSDLTLPLISLVVFDTSMFALTFGRAVYMKRYYRSYTRLMGVILLDGGLYFISLNSCLSILVRQSIANGELVVLGLGKSGHDSGNHASSWSTSLKKKSRLTCIFVSRLFLNLRLIAYRSERFHTKPEDITYSLGIWRIPGSTFNSSTETRRTLPWLLPDLSSYTEFHVSLPGFDTHLLHKEVPENSGDDYHEISNPAEFHV
ncbi:hypothetical protein M422DRAFT_51432 [Sphaerobolus stellatus SS14]|uniref:Uncharacterized protein n=1 Tax=Sphaerobolus stellatus (strain SS14) TaxID=990650 RepID=A0A0C9TYI7_SPHS4|nr:hypothetical protein M422DRAFT_51432 [Sphaerobolus stellatus SS14]